MRGRCSALMTKENANMNDDPRDQGFGKIEPRFHHFDLHGALEARAVPLAVKRLIVTADALLSADEVVNLIGGRKAPVRAWLRAGVPTMPHPTGRTLYRWGDVVDAMRRAA